MQFPRPLNKALSAALEVGYSRMASRVKTTEKRAQPASSGRSSAVYVTATSSLKAQALLPPWMSSAGKSSYTQMAKVQVHTGG